MDNRAKKILIKIYESLTDLLDNNKRFNTCFIGAQSTRERGLDWKKVLEEITAENVLRLAKDICLQIQESKQIPK